MPDPADGRQSTSGSRRLNRRPSNRSIAIWALVAFSAAAALRVPSCYESLWVDELHTAWCIWDDLGDVAPRADLGHQSPFYFVALWFWKQIAGGSELALRMTSVLAVATSCGLLVFGMARWSHSIGAGITAGLILAIERNSIFFGTELRPFAFVILLATIASICFLRLASVNSRHDDRVAWLGLVGATLLAALCQPTSLGVLLWLPAVLFGRWLWLDRRGLLRLTLTDGLLALSGAAVGFGLWSMTLGESWDQRSIWADFAAATSIWQAWQAWDWIWLWCIPVGVLALCAIDGASDRSTNVTLPILLVAFVAASATFSYWLVARTEWLPLWHRRYFIAVLPLLAIVTGGCVAAVAGSSRLRQFAPLVCVVLIAGLVYRQQMHWSLWTYPVAYATRGEDWRGAVQWVRQLARSSDQIYVESGLIESSDWSRPVGSTMKGADPDPFPQVTLPDPEVARYLCFPVLGPYQLGQPVEPIGGDLNFPIAVLNNDVDQVFMIVRRPARRIPIDPTKWGWVYGNRSPKEVKSFGSVTVIQLPVVD